MAYQALYRSYRPHSFADVVGQETVTKTLAGQIMNGKIGHAYLFSGPRGIGKTTIARIFARAINCASPVDGDPCGHCPACLANAAENNMDILEIDAASNNGVDHIRDLRENVGYLPANGKYRVYIIDEVHMLSVSAFNALLKTLEEPPAHAVFILATTEVRKLPETVLSRCQRYEFRRMTNAELISRLNMILEKEHIDMEPRGVAAIARAAEGGMRDAISMLDQCTSLAEGTITADRVYAMLGITDRRYFQSLSQAILSGNTGRALDGLNVMLDGGGDVAAIGQELLRYFRDLFLCVYVKDPSAVLSMDEDAIRQLQRQANSAAPGDLLRIMSILAALESDLRYASQPRVLLELAVARCCHSREASDTDALLTRIERLEAAMRNGTVPAAPAAEPAPRTEPAPVKAAPAPVKAVPETQPAAEEDPWGVPPPPMDEVPPPADWDEPAPVPMPEPPTPEPPAPETAREAKSAGVPINEGLAERLREARSGQPGEGKHLWTAAMELLPKDEFMTVAAMRRGLPALKDDVLTVSYAPESKITMNRLDTPEKKAKIAACLEQAAGRKITLELKIQALNERQKAFVDDSKRKLAGIPVEVDYES